MSVGGGPTDPGGQVGRTAGRRESWGWGGLVVSDLWLAGPLGATHTLTDSVAEGDGGRETEAFRVANEKPSKQYLVGI